MSGELTFGWATPGDLAAVEEFHARCFGPDSFQALPGRVKWLYFTNPLGLHVALCRDGERIVAACGHLPQPVRVGGELLVAGFGIDFMVDSDHRRRGIGRRFLAMRRERFRLSLSTGQSPAMRSLYAEEGGVELGPVFTGIHRHRPPLLARPRAYAKGWAAFLAGRAGARPEAQARSGSWAEAASRMAMIRGDDAAGMWLRWRCDGPVYDDHEPVLVDGDVAVVRHAGHRCITTTLAAKPRRRVPLLAALAGRGTALETVVTGAGEDLHADLVKAGFLVRPTDAVLMGMTMDDELRRRLRPDAVEIDAAAGDADLLRRPGA